MLIRFNRGMVALLIASMVWVQSGVVFAQAEAGGAQPEVVKQAVEKAGVGRSIGVRLTSGEVLHGYIASIAQAYFGLQLANAETIRKIPYSEVAQLRTTSKKLLWAALGVSVVAAVMIVIAVTRTPKVHPYTPPASGS